jgi:hypothetical protein
MQMTTRAAAILLGTVYLLQAMTPGQAAGEECIRCRQNYEYICLSNFQECGSGCKVVGTSDKAACQRRCLRTHNECSARMSEKCGKCQPDKFILPPPVHIIQ